MATRSEVAPATEAERLTQAIAWACAHINRRERTVAEVRAHLEQRGVSPVTLDAALAELEEQHLVDDTRFATIFVEDKRTLEAWGVERIRRGLRARGIDRELAEQALGGGDDLTQALELLRRRFPDPPRERRDRDRALGMLVRKGYESELALDALAAYARGD